MIPRTAQGCCCDPGESRRTLRDPSLPALRCPALRPGAGRRCRDGTRSRETAQVRAGQRSIPSASDPRSHTQSSSTRRTPMARHRPAGPPWRRLYERTMASEPRNPSACPSTAARRSAVIEPTQPTPELPIGTRVPASVQRCTTFLHGHLCSAAQSFCTVHVVAPDCSRAATSAGAPTSENCLRVRLAPANTRRSPQSSHLVPTIRRPYGHVGVRPRLRRRSLTKTCRPLSTSIDGAGFAIGETCKSVRA